MKALIKQYGKLITLLGVFLVPLFLASQANADPRSFNYWQENGFTRVQGKYVHKHSCCTKKGYWVRRGVPAVVAACTTSVTIQPLPTYVCCKMVNRKGQGWRNTWVSGACRAASPYAKYDGGCTINSPVYGTGAPILQRGQCQFSNSMHHYSYR